MKKNIGVFVLMGLMFAAGTMITSCGDKKKSPDSTEGAVAEKSSDEVKTTVDEKNSEKEKAEESVVEENYSIVGAWKYPDPDMAYVYTFNADGTGSYSLDGYDLNMPFTYKDDGKTVEIHYDGDTGSTKHDYSISGKTLTIKDDFDTDVVYERK